ncbi:MAG TPA: cytochrome c [Terriglobia bacterium]|nr:cytochrome c [Terriglobia bacterium]
MKRVTTVSVCGIFALASWSISFAMARPTAPLVLQDDVKQVYLNKCSVCHGEDGAGKTAKGKKLKMKDIRSAEVQKMTQAQWTDAIVKGSGQDMDAFGKELGPDMSRKLADYMRELAKK